MHRIVVLQVYQDLIYKNAGRVKVGIFNKEGELVETKLLPGFMFVQTKENPIKDPATTGVHQELKLIPVEAVNG